MPLKKLFKSELILAEAEAMKIKKVKIIAIIFFMVRPPGFANVGQSVKYAHVIHLHSLSHSRQAQPDGCRDPQ